MDTDVAIRFLREFHGDALWVLTAIHNGGIATQTFDAQRADQAQRFIRRYAERGWNLYFLPATPHGVLGKKPSKSDIASTRWLWVDLDPRVDEDLAGERERLLGLLTHNLPNSVPGPPTLIVDSGRGFWGYWRLKEPAGIEAEEFMRELERIFSADKCHNIDRVARLPGTLNTKTGERACVITV
ncbi:MAG: hypothetical protein AAGI27_00680 [Pseudomonadota bacterium]